MDDVAQIGYLQGIFFQCSFFFYLQGLFFAMSGHDRNRVETEERGKESKEEKERKTEKIVIKNKTFFSVFAWRTRASRNACVVSIKWMPVKWIQLFALGPYLSCRTWSMYFRPNKDVPCLRCRAPKCHLVVVWVHCLWVSNSTVVSMQNAS